MFSITSPRKCADAIARRVFFFFTRSDSNVKFLFLLYLKTFNSGPIPCKRKNQHGDNDYNSDHDSLHMVWDWLSRRFLPTNWYRIQQNSNILISFSYFGILINIWYKLIYIIWNHGPLFRRRSILGSNSFTVPCRRICRCTDSHCCDLLLDGERRHKFTTVSIYLESALQRILWNRSCILWQEIFKGKKKYGSTERIPSIYTF